MSREANLYRGERAEILKFVPDVSRRILDVGCSVGDLGAALKRRSAVYVAGIEINPTAAAEAKTKLDAIYSDPIEKLDFSAPGDRFDCILFADVLEHFVTDPFESIRRCLEWLEPQGVMIFSIPNVNHLSVVFDLVFRGEWRYCESGIMDRTHLRFFTDRSFKRLLDESGLVIAESDYILSMRGSRLLDKITFGLLRRFLVAQYVFTAKRRSLS